MSDMRATTSDDPGVLVLSRKRGTPRPCETCGEDKRDGRRECGKCRSARFRSDAVKAERARAASRRWKDANYERELARLAARQEVVS